MGYSITERQEPRHHRQVLAVHGSCSLRFVTNWIGLTIPVRNAQQMLAAIGETFETPYGESPSPDMPFTDEVTGVIVSSRKAFYRISIWTRSAESLAKVGDIGKHFKHGVLGVSGKIVGGYTSDVEFQSHRDSQVSSRTDFTALCVLIRMSFAPRSAVKSQLSWYKSRKRSARIENTAVPSVHAAGIVLVS